MRAGPIASPTAPAATFAVAATAQTACCTTAPSAATAIASAFAATATPTVVAAEQGHAFSFAVHQELLRAQMASAAVRSRLRGLQHGGLPDGCNVLASSFEVRGTGCAAVLSLRADAGHRWNGVWVRRGQGEGVGCRFVRRRGLSPGCAQPKARRVDLRVGPVVSCGALLCRRLRAAPSCATAAASGVASPATVASPAASAATAEAALARSTASCSDRTSRVPA